MPDYEKMKEQYGTLSSISNTIMPPSSSVTGIESSVPQLVVPVDSSVVSSATQTSEAQDAQFVPAPQTVSHGEYIESLDNDTMDEKELVQQLQSIVAKLTLIADASTASTNEQQFTNLYQLINAQQTTISQLCSQINKLEGTTSRLTDCLNALTENAAKQEKANLDILRDSKNFQATTRERMQRELDGYKKVLSATGNAPILTELSKIDVSVRKAIERLGEGKDADYLRDGVLDSIEELLEDNGVEIRQSKLGTARSVKYCKTMKAIPTGNETLHGAVAKSYNPSFTLENLVMVKELVDTYQYDPNTVTDSLPEDELENGNETNIVSDTTQDENLVIETPTGISIDDSKTIPETIPVNDEQEQSL